MAKRANRTVTSKPKIAKRILPESYTLETSHGILQQQGVHLRHKELAAELTAANSLYKQLLQLPALIIYNQSLLERADNACDFLIEQIVNIAYAMTEVSAKYPTIPKPLTEKRLSLYQTIQNLTEENSNILHELSMKHIDFKYEVFDKLKADLGKWKALCRQSAEKLTAIVKNQGIEVPVYFPEILAKHLERAGTNSIKPEELHKLNIKGKLSYAEQAMICALSEVNANGH